MTSAQWGRRYAGDDLLWNAEPPVGVPQPATLRGPVGALLAGLLGGLR